MLVLGIDTSSAFLGLGLLDKNSGSFKIHEDGGLTHSERLLPKLKELFAMSDKSINDIKKVVVTVGPGSFTGIRIGVSTANAFALGLNIPVIGISTLESMAYCAKDYKDLIVSTMDAQRGNFYTLFCKFEDGRIIRLKEESVSSKDEIIEFVRGYGEAIILGDALKSWTDMPKELKKSDIYSPDPIVLCEIGELREYKGGFAEPVYIRKSQAEVEYDRKNNK